MIVNHLLHIFIPLHTLDMCRALAYSSLVSRLYLCPATHMHRPFELTCEQTTSLCTADDVSSSFWWEMPSKHVVLFSIHSVQIVDVEEPSVLPDMVQS